MVNFHHCEDSIYVGSVGATVLVRLSANARCRNALTSCSHSLQDKEHRQQIFFSALGFVDKEQQARKANAKI
jgi:hypothetical protein